MILSNEQFAVRASEEFRNIRITFTRFWWWFRAAKIFQEFQLTSGRQIGHGVIPAAGATAMNRHKVFSREVDLRWTDEFIEFISPFVRSVVPDPFGPVHCACIDGDWVIVEL